MGVKDEHARILMTHEAASEHGDDARQFLPQLKDRGLKVTAAFSDYSQSFTEAIKAVFPHARLQADHVPYGQECLGPPQEIALILPQAGQGERGSPVG
jgi:transposase-like protein